MDHDTHQHGLRHRASQCLTWFVGSTQAREPYQHSARQHADGFLRRLDDPDVRQRQRAPQEGRMTLWERLHQVFMGHQGQGPSSADALRHDLEHQQRQREQPQRHQGGWGHGREHSRSLSGLA